MYIIYTIYNVTYKRHAVFIAMNNLFFLQRNKFENPKEVRVFRLFLEMVKFGEMSWRQFCRVDHFIFYFFELIIRCWRKAYFYVAYNFSTKFFICPHRWITPLRHAKRLLARIVYLIQKIFCRYTLIVFHYKL